MKRSIPKVAGFAGFLTLMLFLSSGVQAKVYKWVDENGKTHFTDSPMKIPRHIKKKMPRKEYKNTDIGLKCFVEMEPEKKKEMLKTRNNAKLWKRENIKNEKYLKYWKEQAEKHKEKPEKHLQAIENIDITEERIAYLKDQIKLVEDLEKIDLKKYKCR